MVSPIQPEKNITGCDGCWLGLNQPKKMARAEARIFGDLLYLKLPKTENKFIEIG